MTTLVRRHQPRITLPIVAYMEIAPGNGAIVLNVSREGLCFQAVAPLQPDEPVHFSFKEGNRHMPGSGELAWLDDRNKCGGLRFTTLSREARHQVDQWLARAASDGNLEPPGHMPDSQSDKIDDSAVGPERSSNAQVVALRLSVPRRAPTTLKLSIKGGRLPAFICAASLASIMLGSLVLFGYAQRRDLGETLVHLGRPWGWQSGQQTAALGSAPQSFTATPPVATAVAPAVLPGAADSGLDRAAESQEAPEAEVTIRHFATEHPPGSKAADARSLVSVDNNTSPPADMPNLPQLALVASAPALSRTPLATLPNPSRNEAQALVTAASSVVNDSTVHMYLDLGKFKDELMARDVRAKVASLGVRATVLKSRSIWKTSYQVLVGPYGDEDEQTKVEADLVSQGYKPRPFERGSRGFVFRSRLDLNGAELPVGDSYTISWESYVENANVRIAHGDDVVATVRGRWVQRGQKFSQDEYVYVRNGANKTLVEIHFAGLKRALVFGGSS